tara:strand:+ start:327 stop:1013 length:687 start_codon:yes stop_codon:yes gene_type:complete
MTLTSRLIMASGSVSGSKTYTTPGTYYWTAPSGVTKVDVTGQGGSRLITQGWRDHTVFSVAYDATSNSPYTSLVGSSFTYEDAEAVMASFAATANTITTSSNGAFYNFVNRRIYGKYNVDGLWYTQSYTQFSNSLLRRTGTFNTSYNFGTGEVTNTSFTNLHPSGGQLQFYGNNYTFGNNTLAFNMNFQNNGNQATYSEISVVEGTTYTIVVGADAGVDTAFVNFDYY